MRLLGCVATCLALLFAGTSASAVRLRCGNSAGDMPAVAAMETEVAAQCDCCGPPASNAPCVVGMVKAALRARGMSRSCARKVLRDSIHGCPLAAKSSPCQVCNSDADCGAGQFCECRTASCNKTGGVCVTRPDVCAQIAAPVCGCDGMTYPNDCERQAAGACKRKNGPCIETGGCVDTSTGQCTGATCSPHAPCTQPDETCSPKCSAPPPQGTCFDLLTRSCTNQACGDDAPCLPNQACLSVCPPPMPVGKCFVTVDGQCSDELCGPDQPCRNPNEFCSPACLGSPACTTDADCDDSNGCTTDRCVKGTCEHECVCVDPAGAMSCCPGPAALCGTPCGSDASGTCGGTCPAKASCTSVADTNTCGCVSALGGPCGGNVFMPPPVCAPGLVCKQSNPDVTGICVEASEPCAAAAQCGGPCTRACDDGTSATGTCVAASDAAEPCTCEADCNPKPTPTPGPCGSVDTCSGACPLVCPNGETTMGQCVVVVLDPPGKLGEPFGPMCRCFGDCSPVPTPPPGPCGDGDSCGGPCPLICPDGAAAIGQCALVPKPGRPGAAGAGCQCIGHCSPPPTPPPGPCGDGDSCGGPCPLICPDGAAAIGQCALVPGLPGRPGATGGGCQCIGDCSPPPTPGPCENGPQCGGSCAMTCPDGTTVSGQCVGAPTVVGKTDEPTRGCACIASCGPPPATPTPGPCNESASCSGTCPFTCPDGTAVTGKCLALPIAGNHTLPGGFCGCVAECNPPPRRTVPVLPHGTICCQCSSEMANKCFDIHWVEVTPSCPDGCKTVADGKCDANSGMCGPSPQ